MADTRPGSGQTVLVTGASMGIGVDLAECFAADGYDVVLTARSEAPLRTLADRLAKDHRVKATVIPGDLAEMGGGSKLAAEVRRRALTIDVLVNNAGYGIAGSFVNALLMPSKFIHPAEVDARVRDVRYR